MHLNVRDCNFFFVCVVVMRYCALVFAVNIARLLLPLAMCCVITPCSDKISLVTFPSLSNLDISHKYKHMFVCGFFFYGIRGIVLKCRIFKLF